MAVDLFSEASPRYSFSNDINQASLVPVPSDPCLLDSGFDFDFGITSDSFNQESSSADELFSQGILLPIQIRDKAASILISASKNSQPAVDQKELPLAEICTRDWKAKEAAAPSTYLEPEEKPQSKPSFWSFKRSISLSCDSECRKGLLSTLQGLSRSKSTGSVPNPKKTMQNKDKGKHPPLPKSSSTSSSSSSSFYQYHQKPPHSKGYYGGSSYGPGGSKPNSVLNVPPPYISNTNLFGLGSLFRNGKDKKPKK